MNKQHYITNSAGWNISSPRMNELLGLNPGEKLPREGMEPRMIQGICVYVLSTDEAHQLSKARKPHRVMAICPICETHVSRGRLQQHVGYQHPSA